MGDLTPFYDVKLDGPDERVRKGYQEFLSKQCNPIHAPEGSCDTPENALAMLRANSHIAVNTLANAAAAGDVKAATVILDKAHGKEPSVVVNVGVVIPPSPSDDEIIARYIAKYGKAEL